MGLQTYPRCLYRGPADETADTCRVADAQADADAQAAGWRPHRALESGPPAAVSPTSPTGEPLEALEGGADAARAVRHEIHTEPTPAPAKRAHKAKGKGHA